MNNEEYLKQKVRDMVAVCLNRLSVEYQFDWKMPQIHYDLRGRTAGQAYEGERLRLNLELLLKYGEEFIKETVAHEAAHIAQRQYELHKSLPRSRPHGNLWRMMMLSLGLKPNRCHKYEVTSARRDRKFEYACSCRKRAYGSRRHAGAVDYLRQYGRHLYHCKMCKANVIFTGVEL